MIVQHSIRPPQTINISTPEDEARRQALQAEIEANTEEIAALQEQIAAYRTEHPVKAPCPTCKIRKIHIVQNNLLQLNEHGGLFEGDIDDDTAIVDNRCPTYYAEISIAADALSKTIAILADGQLLNEKPAAYATGGVRSLLVRDGYILLYRGDDAQREGNKIYRLIVCASRRTPTMQIQDGELTPIDTYTAAEEIDILTCYCGEQSDNQAVILTERGSMEILT